MKTERIKSRSTVFTYELSVWNLNLHLIEGGTYDFVIDTGLGSGSVVPIQKIIAQNKKPVIVINTHHHWDHIWGNCAFDNSVIISHRLCRDIIEQKWDGMIAKNSGLISGKAVKRLPDVTFEDGIYFPGEGIRVFYTPGHTEDCISVYDERDRILNAGDNIGDTPDEIVPELDCGREIYIKTLQQYNKLGFELCVSGHNTVQGKDAADRILKALEQEPKHI